MQGCAAANHGIKNNAALHSSWSIIVAPLGVLNKMLEDQAKGGPAAARPPLVQVGIGTMKEETVCMKIGTE